MVSGDKRQLSSTGVRSPWRPGTQVKGRHARTKKGPPGLPPPEGPCGRRCPDHGKRAGTSGYVNSRRTAQGTLYPVTQSGEIHGRIITGTEAAQAPARAGQRQPTAAAR